MKANGTLSPTMSAEQFEEGYRYYEDLERFAKRLGVPRCGAPARGKSVGVLGTVFQGSRLLLGSSLG